MTFSAERIAIFEEQQNYRKERCKRERKNEKGFQFVMHTYTFDAERSIKADFVTVGFHILYLKRKIIQRLVAFFFFLLFSDLFCHFTLCDINSAFLDVEALYLRAHWLERTIFFQNLYGKVANDDGPNFHR